MLLRTKEQRRARQILDMMIFNALCASVGYHEVGRFTKKLKPEDGEALKHLRFEDVQDRIK